MGQHVAEDLTASQARSEKARSVSKVGLTSFVVYKVKGKTGDASKDVEVLVGGNAARYTSEGRLQLLASGVPFHSERVQRHAPKAGHGLLALYGHRDALEELQFWRGYARERGAEFAYVNYDIEVGHIFEALVSEEKLRGADDSRFLNLRRTTSDLQKHIHRRFQDFIAEEKGDLSSMAVVAHMARRPDLFDRLFAIDPIFSRLSIFVIPIADDPAIDGKMRQVAYVRPNAKVLQMVQGSSDVDVLLPAWIGDESAAKAIRQFNAAGL